MATIMQMPALQASPGQMAELKVTASQIARARNDLSAAEKYLVDALKDAKTISNSRTLLTIQSELSDLYRVNGNLSKAEEMARRAAAWAQAAGYTPLVPELLSGLAQVQISGKHYHEADNTYDRAAAIQDMMIGNANSALGKTALVNGASGLYAKHFALLADYLDNPAKAFLVIEQARGRVMTDLLRSGARTSPESLETENEISRLRLKLAAAQSDRQIRELRDAIFLTEQRRSIAPEVSILKPKSRNSVTLSALQKDLSPAEAVLEYVLDDPASYCLAITHTSVRIAKLKGKAAISADVGVFLKEVKAKHAAQGEARRLYADLIDVVPETQHQRRLIVVRDGPLHLVPFDALMDSTNRYLVDSRIVTYAPSASSILLLRSTRQHKTVSQGLLAVGGVPYDRSGLKASSLVRGYADTGLANLPNSEDEARTATAALPSPANTLLLGDGATEWAFKKAVNHRIIHLAVHGIANELHPERAAVVLLSDPAKGEDGFLQASEIVQLALDADLVVLSACDTAVGPVEGQEGIANLSKAFLLAGARTVISTLWSVEDETALFLMKEFYAQLAHGSNAADALASAKRTMLKTFGQTKAVPYYWAGFTLEGFVPQQVAE
jgi:CHAT domain-containing protein